MSRRKRIAASLQPSSPSTMLRPALHGSRLRRRYHRAAWDSSGVPPPPRVRPKQSLLDEPAVKPLAMVQWRQPERNMRGGRILRARREMM